MTNVAMPVIPFTSAAHEHTEPAFDVSFTPGTSSINYGPFDVPAYGFLRNIVLEVTFSGGTMGSGVLHPDAPFNVLQDIQLADVNGGTIFGAMGGYETFLTNLIGGYDYASDPRQDPDYNGAIASKFYLRVPVEISHHDGFGAISNQNAAAAYKVSFRSNVGSGPMGLFTTAPTTMPTVRVRGWLEAWSAPSPTDPAGRPQAVLPPRHGTTQYWSQTSKDWTPGQVSIQLPRVGQLIRTLVCVVRDTTGGRVRVPNNNLPDPIELVWDQRSIHLEPVGLNRSKLSRSLTRFTDLPQGVFAYQLDRLAIGHSGDGGPGLWYPTVQSTRLELKSSALPAAAQLTVMTNDVAPVEVNPTDRYELESETGFQPTAYVGGTA